MPRKQDQHLDAPRKNAACCSRPLPQIIMHAAHAGDMMNSHDMMEMRMEMMEQMMQREEMRDAIPAK